MKPHCYGKMDWILKYPEDDTPKESICVCHYTNSCLRLTRNKNEEDKMIMEDEGMDKQTKVEVISKCKHAVGIARPRYKCSCNNDIHDTGDCHWDDQSKCKFYVACEDGKCTVCGGSAYLHYNDCPVPLGKTELEKKPREPVAEEKGTVSRKKMVIALMENPKRTAQIVKDVFGKPTTVNNILRTNYDNLIWDDGEILPLFVEHDKSEWTIIEPPKQLKKMTMGEAIRLWDGTKGIMNDTVKSIVTGETFEKTWKNISLEACRGLWTIEGVYEDD